jgi:diketogulonate reductase-like aldo/keto reductase
MEKFARQCDLTNELMNEGWVIGDGDMYIKYEADAINAAIKMGYKSIDDAYKEDAMYWTEWEDEDDFQYGIDEQNNIIEL